MKFALCNELFRNGRFEDWSWEKALELTRECGYTGWEIAPFTLANDIEDFSEEHRRDLARQIEQAGVEVVGLHWLLAKTKGYHLTTNDPEIRERTADYLGKLARLCRDLGGSVMVLGSPQQRNFPEEMSHEQADANAVSVLEQLIPALEKHQVTLALEPLGPSEGNFWNHASQAEDVIQGLGNPFVQLHLDVKAMSSEGRPIPDIIRDHSKHLAHFHANDPNLLGPGMGEVDFRPIFAALKEIDYQGWVSVEVFDYEPGIETIARESMRNMQVALQGVQA